MNSKSSLPLHGKAVVMTGTLSIPREQFAILLEDAGAVVCTSLSKSTDILIVGVNPGDVKLDKARENKTTIWDEMKARTVMAGKSVGLYTQKVFGCSDDVVELTGSVHDELSGGDEPTYVRFSTGTYLKIVYSSEGIWRIHVFAEGESAKCRKLYGMPDDDDTSPAQAHHDTDAPVYSDVLIFESEVPITLESWGRKPLKQASPSLAVAKAVFKALEQFGGFEFFEGELEQQEFNEALAVVAEVVDQAIAKRVSS